MDAQEIRDLPKYRGSEAVLQTKILAEIAAQLAEFNAKVDKLIEVHKWK